MIVIGEAALERQLARKSPTAIWFEPAITHRCQVCETEGLWDERWIAWARYNERHAARGEGTDLYCSEECCRRENPDAKWPSWMNVCEEPRPKEQERALWRAQRADADAQAAARRAIRGVPMPEWPGDGFCKWCTKPVERPRRSWHAECYPDYLRHTDSYAQAVFLRKRDGPACAWAGCEARGEEVDHRAPLWSIAHLPDEERRWYFGPGNLWLLCPAHHKAKTADEAALRARLRAGDTKLHLVPTNAQLDWTAGPNPI